MFYNIKYTSVIFLGFLNAFALGLPTNSNPEAPIENAERSIDKRALLDPPTLAAIANIEAQTAASVASLLAAESAAILKIVG